MKKRVRTTKMMMPWKSRAMHLHFEWCVSSHMLKISVLSLRQRQHIQSSPNIKSNLATHVNIPRYHARRQCRWHLGSATQGYLRRQSMWRVVIWSLIWQTCSVLDVFITFWVRLVRYGKVWWFDRNMRGCIITFCITSILGPVYLTPQIARELV